MIYIISTILKFITVQLVNYMVYSTYIASSFYCQASEDGCQGPEVIQIGGLFMLHLFTLDGLSFQN
jgi:hypothetical protein